LARYRIGHVGFNSEEKWTYKMCKKVLISVKHSDKGVIWEQFPGKFISINGQTISVGTKQSGRRKATESYVNLHHYDAN